MKENDVAFLGTLLNLETDAVNSAIEDGTIGEKITGLRMVSKSDVDTLKTNLTREVKTSYLSELEEAAKKGDLPQEIYKPVNGAVLEKLEKKLSKEYNVSDFDGIDDLVAKAIKNTAQPDDTRAQELLDKITALQEVNTKLVSDKDEEVKKANEEKNSWILNREKTDFINQVPFDFSDVEDTELENVTAKRRDILSNVFDAQYNLGFKEDKIAVFKDGEALLKEATLEPVSISDVLKKTASELGLKLKSPETGGQGGKSSGKKTSLFNNEEEFRAECKAKGFSPSSAQGIALLKKSGLKLF